MSLSLVCCYLVKKIKQKPDDPTKDQYTYAAHLLWKPA